MGPQRLLLLTQINFNEFDLKNLISYLRMWHLLLKLYLLPWDVVVVVVVVVFSSKLSNSCSLSFDLTWGCSTSRPADAVSGSKLLVLPVALCCCCWWMESVCVERTTQQHQLNNTFSVRSQRNLCDTTLLTMNSDTDAADAESLHCI